MATHTDTNLAKNMQVSQTIHMEHSQHMHVNTVASTLQPHGTSLARACQTPCKSTTTEGHKGKNTCCHTWQSFVNTCEAQGGIIARPRDTSPNKHRNHIANKTWERSVNPGLCMASTRQTPIQTITEHCDTWQHLGKHCDIMAIHMAEAWQKHPHHNKHVRHTSV